jgi:predicted RNA-binding protein
VIRDDLLNRISSTLKGGRFILKYYVAVAMDVELPDSILSAIDITKTLLEKGFWAFSASAPVKQKLAVGDNILFYVGGKNRHYFVANGLVKSTVDSANEKQKAVLDRLGIAFFNRTVSVGEIDCFQTPVGLIPLKEQLSFIADKKNYGLSLRLPLREIPKEDYLMITSKKRHP